MKKALKITGAILLSLIGLFLIALLLMRFCFRDEAKTYYIETVRNERIELLRAATPYKADSLHFRFAYRQDTAKAREIRIYFNLDTLLNTTATTWDNTLAVARFVADNIPHENQRIQPETRNAIALWEYTRSIEPAFNCRLHSIMLHELLLASGIVNRFVTCLPADPEDKDCHVVNIVWLPERQKWAMIDSDMKAWIADADGTPLSLEEMRSRMLDGIPMEVCPLSEKQDENAYLAYWSKNLYWFECWEETGYDKEVNYVGRRIELLPPGFESFWTDASIVCTTDATRFWAAPETESLR